MLLCSTCLPKLCCYKTANSAQKQTNNLGQGCTHRIRSMPQSKEDPLTAIPAFVSVFETVPTMGIPPKPDLHQSLSTSHDNHSVSSPPAVSTIHTEAPLLACICKPIDKCPKMDCKTYGTYAIYEINYCTALGQYALHLEVIY